MRSPVVTLFFVLLIAPAAAGAQEAPEPAPATASPASAPAPDARARAPAKSRSIFGQAMAELTRSVEATRASPTAPANALPAAKTASSPTPPGGRDQVATHEPVE